MKRREPPSSNSDDEEYHPAKVAAYKPPLLLSTLDLPVEVLHHIITFMKLDELSICSIVSKTWCELVDRICKEIIQHEWKSNLSCLVEPANGSWRSQLFLWCDDFSKLKHGLPKVTWCVENGADVKLLSLLHSPPPHRKRFLRLLNPPTMLRMEDSPLHYACAVGCVDVVEIILSYEVAKECLNKPALGVSHQGISAFWTPLHYAISYGHSEIVTLLIEHGANAHLEKGVMSPFQLAQLCATPQIKASLAGLVK